MPPQPLLEGRSGWRRLTGERLRRGGLGRRGTALYIRTSTADQEGQAQLNSLRGAARARGWLQVQEFIDLGHSGSKAHRPALDQLRAGARAGEVRQVLVFGLDRLGRSLRDPLLLLDDLAASGCSVISLRESIDLSTPLPGACWSTSWPAWRSSSGS